MSRLMRWLPVLLVLALVPACAMQKSAAEKALTAAEAAYAKHLGRSAERRAGDGGRGGGRTGIPAGTLRKQGLRERGQGGTRAHGEDRTRWPSRCSRSERSSRPIGRCLTEAAPGALTALGRKLEDFGQPPAGMPERAQYDQAMVQPQRMRALRWAEA